MSALLRLLKHPIWLGLGWLGLVFLHLRLGPASRQQPARTGVDAELLQQVCVLIPARNEAARLPELLQVLQALPLGRIRVLDDHSSDQTAQVAVRYGAEVFVVPPRPADWSGKNWACWQGAQGIQQPYLLFLDADIVPDPQALQQFMTWFQQQALDLACPLLYHAPLPRWERFFGAFHLLYLLGTGLQTAPGPDRLYANGQCMVFRRAGYARWGHAQVAAELAEDLAMARRCLKMGGRYQLYRDRPVYRVCMYPRLTDFVQGWRRNLRLGLRQSPPGAVFEVFCLMLAALGGGAGLSRAQGRLLAALTMLSTAVYQRRWGDFSPWGAFNTPVAVLGFMGLSLWGLMDRWLARPIVWKSRAYPATRSGSDA